MTDYVKTNWVNNSTELNATNMNHIETGIDLATDVADAAIPKSTVTAAGDLIYGTASAVIARLAAGTPYHMLTMNAAGTAPAWVASPKSLSSATGDLTYASAANTLARRAIGTASQVLTVSGGVPVWATPASAGGTVYEKTTEKEVTGTVTKTDLLAGEITIGANVMGATGYMVIDCGGTYLQSTGTSKTIVLELKLGSQVLWDSNTSGNFASSATARSWRMHAMVMAMGATNAQRGGGWFHASDTSTAATTGTGGLTGFSQVTGVFETVAATVDMTSAQTLTLSVTHSTNSGSISMKLEDAIIRVFA